MVDPVAILGGLKVVSEAKRAGLDLLGGEDHVPKFGFGSLEAERLCKSLDLFLTVAGVTSTTRHRLRLAPSLSPLDAKVALGQEIGTAVDQDNIQDECGYTLSQELTRAPMSELSAGCRLGLKFVYHGNAAERSGSGVIGGLKRGMGSIFTNTQLATQDEAGEQR